MTYDETIDYLFSRLPVYQEIGAAAYKPGLERVERILASCGAPHRRLRTIHVAGTNGKGSTSSMLASILHAAGYRVGLFTSPHLVDFRERIRIDGVPISKQWVTDFVEQMIAQMPEDLEPSFFELTTAMSFAYFADQEVDYAVIEVGMGGRLDSTNVLQPLLSIITNVSLDHAAFLGDTLGAIAYEKAGIIKPHTPALLGRSKESEVREVVVRRAAEIDAPLTIADEAPEIFSYEELPQGLGYRVESRNFGEIELPLYGPFQIENLNTVLHACRLLTASGVQGLSPESVARGVRATTDTGLYGRLTVVETQSIRIVLDAGHNSGAWAYLSEQLTAWSKLPGGVVALLGFAADKGVQGIIPRLPSTGAYYLFSQASSARALPATDLEHFGREQGLACRAVTPLTQAYREAVSVAQERRAHTLYIGGSFFVIGELLAAGLLPHRKCATGTPDL